MPRPLVQCRDMYTVHDVLYAVQRVSVWFLVGGMREKYSMEHASCSN